MLLACIVCFAKNETTAFFTVNPPMVCQNCEKKIKDNIKFEKGIKAINPSAQKGVVEVVYDADKTNVDAIIKGFKKIGYDATLCQPEVCPENATAPCCAPQAGACCGAKSESCVAPACEAGPDADCK